ncbi:hypothetical protein NL676_035180 [Syzygium grande]|nr:hypothetical protein NL676_035180 [Syzygium grande]
MKELLRLPVVEDQRKVATTSHEPGEGRPFTATMFPIPHVYFLLSLQLHGTTDLLSSTAAHSLPDRHQNPQPQRPRAKSEIGILYLEVYLAKREGIDRALKISMYATKIILFSSVLPETLPLPSPLSRASSIALA